MNSQTDKPKKVSGYAPVNGLKMYYEIEGGGDPLVYVPAAFGFAGLHAFPSLVQGHSVITVDLQGNGRTADIQDRPISIEQYAKDVVGLLEYLKISKADFFGESYGGDTVATIALRYPELVKRVAVYGASFGPPRSALNFETLPSIAPTADSRCVQFERENYMRVAATPQNWERIFDKIQRIHWEGFSREELTAIQAPLLIIVGDHDFVRLEHAVETFNCIPNAELAVIPDASHYVLFSEPDKVIPAVKHFMEQSEKRVPLAVAGRRYFPGESR